MSAALEPKRTPGLRDDLATDVVAVARELLSNAVRHADADRVSLAVEVIDGEVMVTVEDDGKGIDRNARQKGVEDVESVLSTWVSV